MTASIFGALLVVGAFGAVGCVLASEKRQRVLCAEGFAALVGHISARLPGLAAMDEIVADFENDALKSAGVLPILQDRNSLLPCNKRLLAAIELQKDDERLCSILLPLAKELGSVGYETQQRSLSDAAAKLKELCEKRRASLAGGEKCCRWLGVLTGAAVVILLL